jgi:acyl-coenzyme A thioesterase PaaI-like protein
VTPVTDANAPDPWQNDARSTPGGKQFEALIAALREVQDVVNGANPSEEVMVEARVELDAIATLLRPWMATERDAPAGKRPDLPGRGHSLLPAFVLDEQSDRHIRGRVRFTRFYLGGNGAAHGGTIPLLFDDVLGRLSNSANRPRARTAYLHVNYRRITPIGPELTIEATMYSEEGRKRYVSGSLTYEDQLLADADGLFVVLRPGQP